MRVKFIPPRVLYQCLAYTREALKRVWASEMSAKARKYRTVAVGGTFDILHKGHKRLIEKALEVGESVLLGVTTNEMVDRAPKTHEINSYEDRVKELMAFLDEKRASDRAIIVPLNDPYGPALTDEAIDVLVVSLETAGRARELNALRAAKGRKRVKLWVIEMVLAEDGAPISTNRIRRGEIDREGRLLP